MAKERKITVVAALFANLGIAIAKFIVAALSGSAAILSEAFHSTVDTGNELLLLLGQKRAKKPPDPSHPFGHGLELYFWTLIVAVLLFGVGGGLSMYEGVTHLLHPPEQESAVWSYLVLGIALVAEGITWAISLKNLKKSRRRPMSLWQTIRQGKDPQLISVFLEDTAALAGILVAATGVTLSHLLDDPTWDGLAAIVIGLILCAAAALLAAETRKLLIGEAADRETVLAIQRELEHQPGVIHVERPLTMHFGPEEVLVNLDVQFKRDLDAEQLARVIDELEKAVRRLEPRAKRIFIEAQALGA